MFENETNKLREDIALWEELLETDVIKEETEGPVAPDKQLTRRKRHLDNASQLGVFIVVLFVIIVLIGLLFGD